MGAEEEKVEEIKREINNLTQEEKEILWDEILKLLHKWIKEKRYGMAIALTETIQGYLEYERKEENEKQGAEDVRD